MNKINNNQEEMKSWCNSEIKEQMSLERGTAEKERITEWKKRIIQERPIIKYKQEGQEGTKSVLSKQITRIEKDISPLQEEEIKQAEMHAATGSITDEFANLLFDLTIHALCQKGISSEIDSINAVYGELMSLKPQDSHEGMLISRMIVLHNQYMHYMIMAAQSEDLDARDKHINAAEKLMRLYNESLEALTKYRYKK